MELPASQWPSCPTGGTLGVYLFNHQGSVIVFHCPHGLLLLLVMSCLASRVLQGNIAFLIFPLTAGLVILVGTGCAAQVGNIDGWILGVSGAQ